MNVNTIILVKYFSIFLQVLVLEYVIKKESFRLAINSISGVQTEMNVMLKNLSTLTYEGKPMNNYKYYMMGQICIAKEHRGQGLFDQLYEYHRKVYQDKYEILLTEVSTSNHRSMRAHERVGFKTIHTYHDHMDEWNVVVWDWRREENR